MTQERGKFVARHVVDVYARCPVNGRLDHYRAVFTVLDFTLDVERILREVATYEDMAIFQEDLTQALADGLSVEVETVGVHSGVETTVTAKPAVPF